MTEISRGSISDLEQGLYIVNETVQNPELDIIVVPGLGADPEHCWAWAPTGKDKVPRNPKEERFNWITNENGLSNNFPKARILRYSYASAWRGTFVTKNYFSGIVNGLLSAILNKRKTAEEKNRPIIFIGHSMGGLVVAEALTECDKKQSVFEQLLPCVTGCIFFGTPFQGTNMATFCLQVAALYKEKGQSTSDTFWTMLMPGSAYLQRLCNDFMQTAGRIHPPIDLRFVYELEPVESERVKIFEKLELGPGNPIPGSSKTFAECFASCFNAGEQFVSPISATFGRVDMKGSVGLQSNHSYLVKFNGTEDEKYGIVLGQLKPLVDNATNNWKKRCIASKQSSMQPQAVVSLKTLLDSGLGPKHEAILSKRKNESWILQDGDYEKWKTRKESYFWMTGPAGVGKTSASLSIITSLRSNIHENLGRAKSHLVPLLAYFLCDTSPSGSSPIELLKSLVLQLINQNNLLADYAKHLLEKSQYRTSDQSSNIISDDGTKATMTLDNLWGCLADILGDESIGDVYIVINNIHLLEDDQYSKALITCMQRYFSASQESNDKPRIREARRWFFTSTERHAGGRFRALVDLKTTHVADLSTGDYGKQIKNSLEDHIQKQVLKLHEEKQYTRDQRYMIHDLMVDNAENKHWIDIQCIRLGALEHGSRTEDITRIVGLNNLSNLKDLVRHCWSTVLERNPEVKGSLTELLRALVLAFRSPSVKELSILSGIRNENEVNHLINQCAPMIHLASSQDNGVVGVERVEFGNATLKDHLLLESDRLLGLSGEHQDNAKFKVETERFHGILSLRCFSYLEEVWYSSKSGAPLDDLQKDAALSYQLQHWMLHAIKGKPELAEDLARDLRHFWENPSPFRDSWLNLCLPDPPSFDRKISRKKMTALHTAAAFGYDWLVASLVKQGHEGELDCANEDGYMPLHIAAVYNHTSTVGVLLECSGKDTAEVVDKGENGCGTALHLAALQGHVNTMRLLIAKKASPNALSTKFGPVINAAIRSGSNEAVRVLLEHQSINLDFGPHQDINFLPPLSLSAAMSEDEVFRRILEDGKSNRKWTPKDYSSALFEACYRNKLDNVNILLHSKDVTRSLADEYLEQAMLAAASEDNWECVLTIFRFQPRLACCDTFYLAAVTMRGAQSADVVLKEIWKTSSSSVTKEVVDAALYQATDNEKDATVAWLLDYCKADANATDTFPDVLRKLVSRHSPAANGLPTFGNALTAAAWDGSTKIVQKLLDCEAQVDSLNGCALQLAAKEGHVDVAKLLLSKGADIDRIPGEQRGYRGPVFPYGTALQTACVYGKTEAVKVLLDANADPTLGRGEYSSPIIAATANNWPEVLKLLLATSKTQVNTYGGSTLSTPLINAARHMSSGAIQRLLEAGSDVNGADIDGNTAITYAALEGDVNTLRLLINGGADILHESPKLGFALAVAAEQNQIECLQVLAEKLSPLFRGLQKAIAGGSAFVRDLVAEPEGEHEIVDMQVVDQQRDEIRNLKQELEELHSIRLGWNEMESQVREAGIRMEDYRQQMNQMRRERKKEAATIEKERDEYKAARYGFPKLQEEADNLKEKLKASEKEANLLEQKFAELTAQHDTCNSKIQELEESINHTRHELNRTEKQLQIARKESAKAKEAQLNEIPPTQLPRMTDFERQSRSSSGHFDRERNEGGAVSDDAQSFEPASEKGATDEEDKGKSSSKRPRWFNKDNSAVWLANGKEAANKSLDLLVQMKKGTDKTDGKK